MGEEVQRLTTYFDAKFDKLESSLKKVSAAHYGAASKVAKIWADNDNKLQKLFGNPGKALDRVFDNSRLKILDSGAARIGLVGSALAELGPVGLAGAAAVGAVVAAFAGARNAARFADEISDAAKAAHLTTDELQELRYALRAAGGEEAGADEAMQKFSATLGKAQEGLPKAQKGFLALGFSKAQIMGFDSAGQALKAVTKAIEGLATPHQKDAAVAQLGLDSMKPLIEDGVEAMQRLRDEAHKVGVVMDSDLVKRGGELNDEFETVSKVIDVQLKSALVDLGPTLVYLLGLMAKLATQAGDIADAFRAIENKKTSSLEDLRDDLKKRLANPALSLIYGASDRKNLARTEAELATRAKEQKDASTPPSGDKSLVDQSKAPKAHGPSAESQAKRFHSMEAQQAAAINDAHDNPARSAEDRAGFAEERLRLERQARDAELADLVKTKAITQTQADTLAEKDKELFAAKESVLATENRVAIATEQLAGEQAVADASNEIDNLLQSLARTQGERKDIALRALRRERDIERKQLVERIKDDPSLRDHGSELLAAFDKKTGLLETDTNRQFPDGLQRYVDAAPASIAELNEQLKNLEAEGIGSLTSGLADAIVNAKDLGDVGSQVFKQLEVQILAMLLQAGAAKALTFLGLGFADGGHVSGPGGSRDDAIPAWLSDGEFVVNAKATSKHRALLEAINNGRAPHFADGGVVGAYPALRALRSMPKVSSRAGPTIIQPLVCDFSGAVVTEDLMRQFQDYADRKATEASMVGAAQGHSRTMKVLQSRATNRMGR